jgi:general secretion pathway protein F
LLEEASAAAEPWWQREVFSPRGMRETDRLIFTRELAAMLKADLPLDEALGVVLLQPGLPQRVRAVARRVLDRVREGQSLSQALSAETGSFPEFYWRLVRAGETGGALGEVMSDLSAYLERATEVRGRITSALFYPLLLILAALGAVGVVMTVLLPAVMPLFADAGVSPPAALAAIASTQDFIRHYWMVLLLAGGTLMILAIFSRNDPNVLRLRDRMLLRMPMLGRYFATRETARFARILSAQLKNGVPLLEALHSTGGVMGSTIYKDAVGTAATNVAQGAALSDEMQASGRFSDLAVRLAGVGERTGQLEVMLKRAADIHETVLERDVERLTRLIGPVLTLVVGVFAGGLILSVMQAILSLNDLALR